MGTMRAGSAYCASATRCFPSNGKRARDNTGGHPAQPASSIKKGSNGATGGQPFRGWEPFIAGTKT